MSEIDKGGKVTDYEKGLVEGLRMAAKMFKDSQWGKFNKSVPIDESYFHNYILSKAEEIEAGAK